MKNGPRWGAIFGLAVACLVMLTTAQDAFAQAPPQRPASELGPGPIPRLSDAKSATSFCAVALIMRLFPKP